MELENEKGINLQLLTTENGEKYVDADGEKYGYIELLELISKSAYKVNEIGLDNLFSAIKIAEYIAPENTNTPFLIHAVSQLIANNFFNSLPTEYDIQKTAKEKITKIIDKSSIVKIKNNPKHIPDIWIAVDGEKIPVEIKLKEFDFKALRQLERYMGYYGCDRGVAIGRSLKTQLPENVRFISIKELEEA